MEKSLIRKILLLISGITVTSLLFFVAISITYDSFYRETLIKDNGRIASNWTSAIDSRLNTLYEHLYDVATVVYRKVDVRSGSPEMDYVNRNGLLDVINGKIMTSSDITAIFIVDGESDLFLYAKGGAVSIVESNNLKYFLRDYCLDNNYSIRNRKWRTLEVLDNSYFYNALKMGKYVIGAVSDFDVYGIDLPYDGKGDDIFNLYIDDGGKIEPVNGDPGLIAHIDQQKEDGYFARGYVVIPNKQTNADTVTYLLTKPESTAHLWSLASLFMIVDSAICVILTLILIHNVNHRISAPIRDLVSANQKLSKGDFEYKLETEQAGSSEFEELYGSFNEMSDKIRDLTIEKYDSEIRRQQNRLKMLRAQVKPHTFLNAINTINNMTYTGKPEDIREYIAAFASFTRYMLYKAKDWTVVEDEIKNINSYVKMQQIRFPESIAIVYDIDPEIYSEQIPYLILFSLVQNSFKHAMTLEDKALISISGEYYEEEGFKGFRLIEEDNGPGFSQDALHTLANAEEDDPFTKEHLGLTNVRYSLNLIYGRDDLLRISNKKEGGAHIELLIPAMEVDDETADL